MNTVREISINNIEEYSIFSFTAEYLKIMDKLNVPQFKIICKSKYYDNKVLDFFEVLSHQALVSPFPLLLLVNSITSVAGNTMWMKYRKNNHDMIIDLEGNVYKLKDIIEVGAYD